MAALKAAVAALLLASCLAGGTVCGTRVGVVKRPYASGELAAATIHTVSKARPRPFKLAYQAVRAGALPYLSTHVFSLGQLHAQLRPASRAGPQPAALQVNLQPGPLGTADLFASRGPAN